MTLKCAANAMKEYKDIILRLIFIAVIIGLGYLMPYILAFTIFRGLGD